MRDRSDNPLVRALGRVPTTLHRKLLVSMVGTVVLLVVLGVLGLGVLGSSNGRVSALGKLQIRTAAYQELQTSTDQLRILMGLRAGGGDVCVYAPCSPAVVGNLSAIDDTIDSTLTRLGPATDVSHLTFVLPPSERELLDQIRQAYIRFSTVATKISGFDRTGK